MISTKGRYAVRIMIDLAEQKGERPTTLDAIAARQGLSKKYLETIIKPLVAAKLVKGTSGKGGGYKLVRNPEEYNVYEILLITEGPLNTVSCLAPNPDICPREKICKTVNLWKNYDNLVQDYFSNVTIKDLI